MSEGNSNSSSQYPSPGPNTSQNTHTHTHTLGQNFMMSSNLREGSGHDAGRRRFSPTRNYDPESSLMGSGGAEVDPRSTHGGVDSATDGNYGSVVAADQHQFMGSGSGYYFRDEQPRQLQGQLVQIKDVGADEVDGQGVGGTSGSDVDGLDTALDDDDPATLGHGASGLTRSDVVTAMEQRHSSLAGLQTTEEQRHPTAAAVCLRGESTTGFKPHSSHVSADGSCSDSVDYTQVQQMMDLVRDLTEDDDDVIHPTSRQLVQTSSGGRKSDSYCARPRNPAEKCDNTSTGKMCIRVHRSNTQDFGATPVSIQTTKIIILMKQVSI